MNFTRKANSTSTTLHNSCGFNGKKGGKGHRRNTDRQLSNSIFSYSNMSQSKVCSKFGHLSSSYQTALTSYSGASIECHRAFLVPKLLIYKSLNKWVMKFQYAWQIHRQWITKNDTLFKNEIIQSPSSFYCHLKK